LFAYIPFLAVALVALYTPFPGHPNSNIVFGSGLMLAVGLAGSLVFGCRFALNYQRFTSSGYVEDSISADVARLAGESWLPGERALHIASPTGGVISVPYHEIGMVCVYEHCDDEGLDALLSAGFATGRTPFSEGWMVSAITAYRATLSHESDQDQVPVKRSPSVWRAADRKRS
jgi:hypothetical protein